VRNNPDNFTFGVFNYSTFHIIKKNYWGTWEILEHRFGRTALPLHEIGKAIDEYYNPTAKSVAVND
jgi:hypothetical protein